MNTDTFFVTAVNNKKKAVCNGTPAGCVRISQLSCPYTHKLTCGKDPEVVFFLCQDCVLKYFRNLLSTGCWKLDSAEIKAHY